MPWWDENGFNVPVAPTGGITGGQNLGTPVATQAPQVDATPQAAPRAGGVASQLQAILQRHGHSPLSADDMAWWANEIQSGRASLGTFESNVRQTMSTPGAVRHTYGAPAAPASSGPLQIPNGDERALFMSLVQGRRAHPDELVALEPELRRYGFTVHRNAQGIAGKVTGPSGNTIDVGEAFSSGDPSKMRWQWLDAPSDPTGMGMGGLVKPWTQKFAYKDFVAPTMEQATANPGFQMRMTEGLKALERAASAKGTLLTGGTAKALTQFGQDYASNEYQNVYNRAADEYRQGYNKALGEYELARQNFYGNQDRPFDKFFSLSQLGLGATNSLNSLGAGYADRFTNTTMGGADRASDYRTSGANADAAGRVGAANARNAGLTGAVDALAGPAAYWAMNRPRRTSYYGGGSSDFGGADWMHN